MEKLKEMTREEVVEFDGTEVVEVYSDFCEKLCGKKKTYSGEAFKIFALAIGTWYTNGDGLYIHVQECITNTMIDFLCKGHSEEEARKLATNDKVTVTSVYKAV